MHYGFCFLAIVPVRSQASDKSEMVSQMLFGDVFQILKEEEKWLQIKTAFDNYEGWIDKKQCFPISEKEYSEIKSTWNYTITDKVGTIQINDNSFPIVLGSVLPKEDTFILEEKEFRIFSEKKSFSDFSLLEIIDYYKGTPYLWGGRSPLGIDCSGFVQNVFKIIGVSLPRDASQQALYGNEINIFKDIQPYDLLFFSNKENRIIHVGIALSDQRIIHASGYVRIDRIDEKGIWNEELNQYTHQLHSAKRVL